MNLPKLNLPRSPSLQQDLRGTTTVGAENATITQRLRKLVTNKQADATGRCSNLPPKNAAAAANRAATEQDRCTAATVVAVRKKNKAKLTSWVQVKHPSVTDSLANHFRNTAEVNAGIDSSLLQLRKMNDSRNGSSSSSTAEQQTPQLPSAVSVFIAEQGACKTVEQSKAEVPTTRPPPTKSDTYVAPRWKLVYGDQKLSREEQRAMQAERDAELLLKNRHQFEPRKVTPEVIQRQREARKIFAINNSCGSFLTRIQLQPQDPATHREERRQKFLRQLDVHQSWHLANQRPPSLRPGKKNNIFADLKRAKRGFHEKQEHLQQEEFYRLGQLDEMGDKYDLSSYHIPPHLSSDLPLPPTEWVEKGDWKSSDCDSAFETGSGADADSSAETAGDSDYGASSGADAGSSVGTAAETSSDSAYGAGSGTEVAGLNITASVLGMFKY